ncbi:HAMP domain-containing sensor histidine kinase [Nisaea sp.]|uniref:sensor histidine kinase n=1 Tax=Nisaea sp. TaxID=2024842 RepID=UPI00329A225B
MFAFFSVTVSDNNDLTTSPGSLITLPPELRDEYRIKKYSEIINQGWTTTEFGYSAYVKIDSFGNRYILPGLYLSDGPVPKKKFYGYKPLFSKKQVENYLSQQLEAIAEVRASSDAELTMLVHDLRHLSSSIYHSAIEAKNAHEGNNKSSNLVSQNIETVIATQTMLKVRIDYLDFANNIDRFDDEDEIPVYSRVDKVVRCFRAIAGSKRIQIRLSGQSYRLARGPNVLDIVPYTIIDNAIKYSPPNKRIDVVVRDSENETIVEISSTGPKIEDAELYHLFSQGFRGKNAIQFRNSGTGLGLAVAKKIIDIFGGKIWASSMIAGNGDGNIEMSNVRFSFSVPTAGEDQLRRRKSGSFDSALNSICPP